MTHVLTQPVATTTQVRSGFIARHVPTRDQLLRSEAVWLALMIFVVLLKTLGDTVVHVTYRSAGHWLASGALEQLAFRLPGTHGSHRLRACLCPLLLVLASAPWPSASMSLWHLRRRLRASLASHRSTSISLARCSPTLA